MLGRMAVAPDRGEVIWNAAPGNFGGNMDTPEIRQGATVYLPVFENGALLLFLGMSTPCRAKGRSPEPGSKPPPR